MQRVTGHSLQLRLKLAGSNCPSPLVSHQLRFPQIIFDFLFQLRSGDHRVERWLGRRIFLGPNPMTPIDFFDRSLIRYALCKRQSSLGNPRVCVRTRESGHRSHRHKTTDAQRNSAIKARKPNKAERDMDSLSIIRFCRMLQTTTSSSSQCLDQQCASRRYFCESNCDCARRRLSAAPFNSGLRRSATSNSGMLSRALPDASRADPRLA